ncbi:MAG: hypothetical protein AABZ30_03400, partial [Myxococcota bacterium]
MAWGSPEKARSAQEEFDATLGSLVRELASVPPPSPGDTNPSRSGEYSDDKTVVDARVIPEEARSASQAAAAAPRRTRSVTAGAGSPAAARRTAAGVLPSRVPAAAPAPTRAPTGAGPRTRVPTVAGAGVGARPTAAPRSVEVR